MSANPLKAVMNIRRNELPFALLMFSYFFLVITSFWILKPLKKGFFYGFYENEGFTLLSWTMQAAQAEQLAKVLNMVVAFAAMVAFSWLARRLRREQLTFAFSIFFLACYGLYAAALHTPNNITVWSFYLFGDLFSTVMVATFFAFLNDSVTADGAKRLYGIVGLGGVIGGAFGSTTLRAFINELDKPAWMVVCAVIMLLIVLVAWMAGRIVFRNPPASRPRSEPAAPLPETKPSNPAVEGARLVFRSPYLLSIVAIVGLYEVVSSIMDFQFSATVDYYLEGDAVGERFATMYAITNWTAMFVQLFLTSFIMMRFGLVVALLVLPFTATVGSLGFLALPVLLTGSVLNTLDNGFSYSINQSTKEALYVPTTDDEKYKAKAFIDMFVMRFAKAVTVGINLLMTSLLGSYFEGVRWLSLVTLVVIAMWVYAARYAGKHFKEITEGNS